MAITILGLSREVKAAAIHLRRAHRLKLPDAIIAGTALTTGATLLTADRELHRVEGLAVLSPALKSG